MPRLLFLPAINALRFDSVTNGIDLKTISYLGAVFARVSSEEVDDALHFLQKTVSHFTAHFAVHLDVTCLSTIEDAVSLLDAGASKVMVSKDQVQQLEQIGNIDADRIVRAVSGKNFEAIQNDVETIGDGSSGLYIEGVEDIEPLERWLLEHGRKRSPLYVSLASSVSAKLENIYNSWIIDSAIPVIPVEHLTLDKSAGPDRVEVALLLQNICTDRDDEMITTLVADERGVALGLVYSTTESIRESLRTGRGVYQSRRRDGLWYKGESSGDVQELVRIELDCDRDCPKFIVRQKGRGFCHLATATCYGPYSGLSRLQKTLQARKDSPEDGSYTNRLFSSPQLLRSKIMEEAEELCNAATAEEIAFEAADVIYFALTKCVSAGVNLEDIEKNLDAKSLKVKRRKGDAKKPITENGIAEKGASDSPEGNSQKPSKIDVENPDVPMDRIRMKSYDTSTVSQEVIQEVLQRPSQRSTEAVMGIVQPIVKDIRERGDKALLEYTHRFEKATSLTSPVLGAPFPSSLMELSQETIDAITTSFDNIYRFHVAQKDEKPLRVETMPGVICSRFSRPIERVGLYIPGGTAVLPSTALMLGVPALVAGCKKIILATPPRSDGSISPEIVYIANKIGAESIVLAGGAQAVAALAYGTESVSKVDKILGPGNQFVTAAKMIVSNDTSAGVSIDMPAGPSEVLVVADQTANPAFVASDLLSQAEHGVDSQVVLIGVDLPESSLVAIEEELHRQASALPRVDIIRGAIDHSVTLSVRDIREAMEWSNFYAPEHLILQVVDAEKVVEMVDNAGSVFIGPWTPESVGDYSAGVNHSLPTYGYARQYSGVNLGSYIKHITSSNLTAEGLKLVGPAVMQMAKVEELEAHRRAVDIRLEEMGRRKDS
ncbi:MAG: trifunctional histidinol dehydrogenase [Peltula sp. TS41687]|nr:MAG: trifunctional histidinol dehydrogenase [Peltula sp. TS41687]